jgi:hypothetical protein
MSICKDCLHYEICVACGIDYSPQNIDTVRKTNDVNVLCTDFKDRSNFIELPCKVGDTVWKITGIWHLDDRESWTYHFEKEVLEFRARSISISCNSKGIWTKKIRICQVENGKTIDNQYYIEFCDFGKTVFLTKEEAEQALVERGKG